MIAFSIEKLSDGRPAIVHSLIKTGFPRVFGRENLPALGMFFSEH
jgi:hypothetical protein